MKLEKLQQLMERLSYQFTDVAWLTQALSHRSRGRDNNERLEFLGDAALSIIISTDLFQRFPTASEGQLSRLRAAMVRRETLAKLARQLQLGDYLILGAGELKSGGSRRTSILADSLEAVIGAIYLDAGMERCHHIVLSWWQQELTTLSVDEESHKDAKTRLQEYLQKRGQSLPHYKMIEVKGAEHSQLFTVSCQAALLEKTITGSGSSRRRAEQDAAGRMLQELLDDKK